MQAFYEQVMQALNNPDISEQLSTQFSALLIGIVGSIISFIYIRRTNFFSVPDDTFVSPSVRFWNILKLFAITFFVVPLFLGIVLVLVQGPEAVASFELFPRVLHLR